MSEVPTKPGATYKVTHEDARRAYTILATGANGFIEALQDFADRRFPTSPWRPASEPPVVPEDDPIPIASDLVLTKVEREGKPSYVYVIQRFGVLFGWEHWGTVAWMPIPPHGEGGAE